MWLVETGLSTSQGDSHERDSRQGRAQSQRHRNRIPGRGRSRGRGSIDEAVEAIRLGAYDFLTKPINIDNLRLVVQRALRERALQDEVATLRAEMQERYAFHNVLSKNPKMHAVFELIGNLAHTT